MKKIVFILLVVFFHVVQAQDEKITLKKKFRLKI